MDNTRTIMICPKSFGCRSMDISKQCGKLIRNKDDTICVSSQHLKKSSYSNLPNLKIIPQNFFPLCNK
jgi:hypothetical protein